MPRRARLFLTLGSIAALTAVLAGAFGAHALRPIIAPDFLPAYRTGVEYHFYHALGLMLVGLAALRVPESRCLNGAGWSMLAGVVLFSGSLYLLALTGIRWLGAITPIGGICFMLAWGLFAASLVKAPGP